MRLNQLLIVAALLPLQGCARARPVAAPVPAEIGIEDSQVAGTIPAPQQAAADRPIGVDDVLDVQVFEVAELSRIVRVSPDGQISYPLLGAVAAVGKTPRELEQNLEDALRGRYLRDPHVTIEIKQYGTPPIYVLGEVQQPGAFVATDRSGLTVLRAVALAKGLKITAAGKRVVLIRTDPAGARVQHTLNMNDMVKGSSPDVALQANDIVYVPKDSEKAIVQGTVDALLRVVSFRGVF